MLFDEYHFGDWRETAKGLLEGEEEAVAKKEAKVEYAAALEDVNEDLVCFWRGRPSSYQSQLKPTYTSPNLPAEKEPRSQAAVAITT